MKGDKLLTNYQFIMLIMGFVYGSTTIVSPGKSAGKDAWLAFIIALIVGTILIYGYSIIAKLNPKKNLVEILREYFGNIFGGIISIFYIWYFIHLGALVFRNFGEFIVTSTFTETPMLFVIGCMAAVVAYATRKGVNNSGRSNEILVPILIIAIIFVNLAIIKYYDYKNLLPVLENGLGPVLNSGFSIITFPFGETIVFLMLFPYLKKQNDITKVSIWGTFIIGLFILSIIIRNIAILGPDLVLRATYPVHTLATLTESYSFEPVIDLAVLTGGGAKIGILMFAACSAIANLFKIKDFRPFALIVVAFTVSLSIWAYKNSIQMFRWATDVWPYYSIPFQIIIPGILLILSFIRKDKINNKYEKV